MVAFFIVIPFIVSIQAQEAIGEEIKTIDCGAHQANSCAECLESKVTGIAKKQLQYLKINYPASFCNGSCYYDMSTSVCAEIASLDDPSMVRNCGKHQARSCSDCGGRKVLCNEECSWNEEENQCIEAEKEAENDAEEIAENDAEEVAENDAKEIAENDAKEIAENDAKEEEEEEEEEDAAEEETGPEETGPEEDEIVEEPPVLEEEPPVLEKEPPVLEEEPPVLEEEPPTTEEEPPTTEEEPPTPEEETK